MRRPTTWMLVLALVLVGSVMLGPVLGHDEASYAAGGRTLLEPGLDAYPIYRPWGMRVLALPGVVLGGSALALRALPVLLGLAYVVLAWRLARRLTGDPAAQLLLAVQATAIPLQLRAYALMSDVPSALCLLAALALAIVEAPRPRWSRGVAIAALLAMGFHLRYGAAPTIAAVGVALAFLWRGHLGRVAVVGAVTALLIAPLLVHSHAITGSPLGVLTAAKRIAGEHWFGQGLVTTAIGWFGPAAGPALGVVAAAGLLGGPRLIRRRRAAGDPTWRGLAALWAVATWHLAWIGLTTHAEPRYLYLSMTLHAVVGAPVVVAWWARRQPRPRLLGALAIALAASSLVTLGVVTYRVRYGAPLEAGLDRLRTVAAGAPCLALTSARPETAWYTHCRTLPIRGALTAANLSRHRGAVFLLWEEFDARQRAVLPEALARDGVELDELGRWTAPYAAEVRLFRVRVVEARP